jgi:DNA-binding transcriptional regulator YhcF (GntR family)
MEFYIEKLSSTPVINQIQEQIKLAVAMGVLRIGDTLPSIRDIEKQTGINKCQIHKAYSALRQSGLLLLTRGKGTIVAAAGDSPRSIHEKCRKLGKAVDLRVRRMGISPTAFARYLKRHAQESERTKPFISYVDMNKEAAIETAAKISQLWQVPVIGLAFSELKADNRKRAVTRIILVNQFLYEDIRSLLANRKSSVILVEERGTDKTIRTLEKIKSGSSVLFLHLSQPAHRIRFIMAHLRKLLEPRGIKISAAAVRDIRSFKELMKGSQYDYFLVGPAARGEIPPDIRQDRRILQINPQLDPASLEIARIRAGVII